MLQFIIRKIISKKWMVLSLLIGNVLLFAIASSCALYENAILQKMLTSNLAGYLEEKDIYPGLTTMRTGVRSGMTSSDMQKYNYYKDLATHLSEDMGVREMYFIQHYYKTVPLIPEVISLDENNENGELTVQDTYHIRALEYGHDSIFGTNEEEVTVTIDVTQLAQTEEINKAINEESNNNDNLLKEEEDNTEELI